MASVPQTYTISDFIDWQKNRQLRLNPDFQRGSVWTPSAKVYLIDTILNDLPIPQVYFRTTIDPVSQTTIREVVDGQQRLRAILEFANGKLRLTSKAPKFVGEYYQTLSVDDQEQFLSYKVPVVQLFNASDANVLEVFARLNSYSVKVTPAELRHARFSEPVKWAIYDAANDWSVLWNDFRIVSVRDSVRLKHTSVMAEIFMIVDQGFGNGGETSINKYYRARKAEAEKYFVPLRIHVDSIIGEIVKKTSDDFLETTFYDSPNFLALFATVGFLHGKTPETSTSVELRNFYGSGINWDRGVETLARIAQAFQDQDDEGGGPHSPFVSASRSTTHRPSSRTPRMEALVRALTANEAE